MEKYINSIEILFGKIIIHSPNKDYLCSNVLKSSFYSNKISKKVFEVFFGFNDFENDNSYRSKQFKNKGLYLGHSIGKKAKLKISSNSIHIYIFSGEKKDYEQVFWSFVLKYILSYFSFKNRCLHLKGCLLKNNAEQGILILGKGNSGKTTLCKILKNYGYIPLSNTHVIINNNRIYGINSWVRERNKDIEYNVAPNKNYLLDCELKKIWIYQYNDENKIIINDLTKEQAISFMFYFSDCIGNYDLKEEVIDYFSNSFIESINTLNLNSVLLEELLDNYAVKYISLDVFNIKEN